jgi:hypothetical protein
MQAMWREIEWLNQRMRDLEMPDNDVVDVEALREKMQNGWIEEMMSEEDAVRRGMISWLRMIRNLIQKNHRRRRDRKRNSSRVNPTRKTNLRNLEKKRNSSRKNPTRKMSPNNWERKKNSSQNNPTRKMSPKFTGKKTNVQLKYTSHLAFVA